MSLQRQALSPPLLCYAAPELSSPGASPPPSTPPDAGVALATATPGRADKDKDMAPTASAVGELDESEARRLLGDIESIQVGVGWGWPGKEGESSHVPPSVSVVFGGALDDSH